MKDLFINDQFSDECYDRMEEVENDRKYSFIDNYRFQLNKKLLCPGNVLDVGAFYGDFLLLALKDKRKIFGTDINKKRVERLNNKLGGDYCCVDFRNGKLLNFDTESIDNVVCTEVIEHIPDDQLAISELFRVARKKVIISVPYKEKIVVDFCFHCGNYLPRDGHFHCYDKETLDKYVPKSWVIVKKKTLGNIYLELIRLIKPDIKIPYTLISFIDSIPSIKWQWLLLCIEKR